MLNFFYSLQNHIAFGRTQLSPILGLQCHTTPSGKLSVTSVLSESCFCYCCGHHPSVVMADKHGKLPLNYQVRVDLKTYSIIYPAFLSATCYQSIS